jgi:hypothetical protein
MKFALKICGSTFSDQLTFFESSVPLKASSELSWAESAIFFADTKLLGLLSLELKGLNASPILTERGRNPRRFEMEPVLLGEDNFVTTESAGEGKPSSAMPPRSVVLDSSLVTSSLANLFFLIERVSVRLEGLLTSGLDGSEIHSVEGDSVEVGDVFAAARDILLTMFLIIRGEDQLRSSLLRLDDANCVEIGVTGKGEVGLQRSLSVSLANSRGGIFTHLCCPSPSNLAAFSFTA